MKNREQFIKDNLGLVHSCASKFKNRGIEYDDLFQAGCVGLVKAFDGFDSSRGFKFSTYAVPVILGEIKRLFRESGSVKVSRSLKELSLKIRRKSEEFLADNGREPSIEELAKLICIDSEDIVQALNASLMPMSLSDSDNEKENQIDIPCPSVEENITEILSLKDSINRLEAKDRSLIFLRFFQNQTQSETAKILGMTQVQISRRERKILAGLKLCLNV